ncbi:MAG: protease inhibitor I42 family protein [Clostridia bacterium]|nr:protease inhibitor I42 family protein [Clostridia bacterium]
MRRRLLFISLSIAVLLMPWHALAAGTPPDISGNAADPDNLLYGTWYAMDEGVHGHAEHFWVFTEDSRFIRYIAGMEPPMGGGEIEGSVSEYLAHGMYRENGMTIECYDIQADSFFAWGNERKYFQERDPALIAGMLTDTPLLNSVEADGYSMDFSFHGSMVLRLIINSGDSDELFDMDFRYIDTAVATPPFIERAGDSTNTVRLSAENSNQLRVGDSCVFYDDEKQSIPYRWRYLVSDESLIAVLEDEVIDTSGWFVMPGGDSAFRQIEFTALSPGECYITLRYGLHGETDWNGEFDIQYRYYIIITE